MNGLIQKFRRSNYKYKASFILLILLVIGFSVLIYKKVDQITTFRKVCSSWVTYQPAKTVGPTEGIFAAPSSSESSHFSYNEQKFENRKEAILFCVKDLKSQFNI